MVSFEGGTRTQVQWIGSIVFVLVCVVGVWGLSQKFHWKLAFLQDPLSQAAALNDAGKYQEAQVMLLAESQKNPTEEVKIALAESFLKEASSKKLNEDKVKKAQDILNQIDQSGYKSTKLFILLGYTFELTGEFKTALSWYQKALNIEDNFSEAFYRAGSVYELAGKPNLAFEYYDNAEKSITKTTDSFAKGSLFIAQGRRFASSGNDTQKAKDYFAQGAKVTSSVFLQSEAKARLSMFSFAQGDNMLALSAAKEAIAIDETNSLGYVAFLQVIMASKDSFTTNNSLAKEYLAKAVALQSNQTWTQYMSAQLSFMSGDANKALDDANKALSALNQDRRIQMNERNLLRCDVLILQSQAYLAINDTSHADAALKAAFQNNPKRVQTVVTTREEFKSFLSEFSHN